MKLSSGFFREGSTRRKSASSPPSKSCSAFCGDGTQMALYPSAPNALKMELQIWASSLMPRTRTLSVIDTPQQRKKVFGQSSGGGVRASGLLKESCPLLRLYLRLSPAVLQEPRILFYVCQKTSRYLNNFGNWNGAFVLRSKLCM